MSIIKNEYPILEFDVDSEEILKPNHSMESTRLQECCVNTFVNMKSEGKQNWVDW